MAAEYTHKWIIEDFDFTMGLKMLGSPGEGKLESGRFCVPGVFGEFHLVVDSSGAHIPDSDIVLKCGDASFLCHKVILATR